MNMAEKIAATYLRLNGFLVLLQFTVFIDGEHGHVDRPTRMANSRVFLLGKPRDLNTPEPHRSCSPAREIVQELFSRCQAISPPALSAARGHGFESLFKFIMVPWIACDIGESNFDCRVTLRRACADRPGTIGFELYFRR